jgi:hypothetical protein
LERDFRQATDGISDDFLAAVQDLVKEVGLQPGNDTITVDEVGAANYRALVDGIARIGDQFDAVTDFPSDEAKLGLWALGVFAQRYDANPNDDPISKPIALLFVATALIFLPAVFASVGGTLFGTPPDAAAVEGVVAFLGDALRAFADGSGGKSTDPLVAPDQAAGIRDQLAARGLTGEGLDAAAEILTLAASLAIADARR